MNKQAQPSRRLFFACWPNEQVRGEVVQRRRLIDGLSPRRVPDHNLHLTLLFLGNQPAERLPELLAATDQLEAAGFLLRLDRFGWFSGARVVWLGGAAPAAAQGLVDRLSALSLDLGLRVDSPRFHPHVTLFRKVDRAPDFPPSPGLDWPVSEFVLMESIPSRPYQVLRTWPLRL
ncbi:MAG: RNA 2',3'-cyclic phosphodiesterase [Wenzhouxiangella sp.]